jgi:hypothetical protein
VENRTCEECNEKLVGRIDKRFCSDYCRNVSNNRKKRLTSKTVRKINRYLQNNYRILEKLNPHGKTKNFKKKGCKMRDLRFPILQVFTQPKKVHITILCLTKGICN